MADFDTAFNWLMDSEDPERKFEPIPDVGGKAIAGINSHSFPTAYARIAALSQPSRVASVYNFYLGYFWTPSWFSQLTSNEVTKRVFDAAVNMGSSVAVKLLQRCLPLDVARDGIWGPDTIRAANRMPENALVEAFKKERREYYMSIPNNEKYLKGWLARCAR